MSDENPTVPKPRRPASFWLAWLLLIVLLAALAGGGYFGWQGWQLLHAQQGQLTTLQSAQKQITQQNQQQQQVTLDAQRGLTQRIDDTAKKVTTLHDELDRLQSNIQGGRERMQLETVEMLLLQAHDHAALNGDPATALLALQLANQRLARIADPQLLPVRRTLAEEISALNEITPPDITGATIQIQQLEAKAQTLPLARRPQPTQPITRPAPTPADASRGWWSRTLDSVGQALRSLFKIRKIDYSLKPVLSPAQALLIRSILAARLAAAQEALQRRDSDAYKTTISSAQAWLADHYQTNDRGVAQANDTLSQLAKMQLRPKLPPLGAALKLLRAQMVTQS